MRAIDHLHGNGRSGTRGVLWNLFSAGVLLAAAGGAIYAQLADRPRSAAIIFILGVTLVGAMSGLKGGLIAALFASLTFNFFISYPTFRFSLTSADELIPLIAFNLSAGVSGLLAGRLRDRALAAEVANQRFKRLLEASERLQHAVKLDQIVPALFAGPEPEREVDLFVVRDGVVEESQPMASPKHRGVAVDLLRRGDSRYEADQFKAFLLGSSSQPIGVLVFGPTDAPTCAAETDEAALASLVTITMQRCLLHEQLADAELIRRSEEFKTALLSSVSHDMRTPLSAISASASSLLRYGEDLGEEITADLLKMIQEQCDRLNRYTANLLNLGRLQSGIDPKSFSPCDALEALGTAILRVRETGAEDVRKNFEVAGATVRADPVMLQQIFYNVLENSLRYAPPAAPIKIKAYSEEGSLTVEISDEGPGIPAGEIKQVFQRFYRAKSVSAVEGSGLGLSIAKGFTEAFGGHIRAAGGEAGRGTTIIISLPLADTGESTWH